MIAAGFIRNRGLSLLNNRYYCSRKVRVRFAPSPTGHLHLGGLRTALYNYLFAKLHKGSFILRIEDTDQTRLVPGATERLQEDLKWSGIKIDEGPDIGGSLGPYIQSHRVKLYNEQVKVLLNNGSAYQCFCTDKRLDLLRKEAVRMRQVPKYDNRCRHLSQEEINLRLERGDRHCIRFKLQTGCDTFEDLIYGNIAYDVALQEGDPVIMKSDGFPTYHFANVVDDHFMQISHVLRGMEWQISTTKHILLYRAFNWEPPKYGHLPLLLNADGTKLSKRQGDIKVSHYRETGILPMALINFITNSGGGFDKDKERGLKPKCYTMMELAQQFDVEEINSHSGKLMPERLLEFNNLEIERQLGMEDTKKKLIDQVREIVKAKFPKHDESTLQIRDEHIETILKWSINRIDRLTDLVSRDLMFLWVTPELKHLHSVDEKQRNAIEKLNASFENNWKAEKQEVNNYLKDFAKENGIAFSNFMKLLRTILSGLKEGPSVAEMIEILGKDNTRNRIDLFLSKSK
ncbi:PREDICTED: probable glutamate--tRNA ligase, mitochondrial [Nicrophorus vespilloides]|uniref:Nondiscriminating glutamyl-tRNA synthetase EARS2, mitochondrial n=1 Tax=Nicrophorus vespilloides TaxID=110193 RepID=A0ABM1MGY4_NICVS|nr:PREDICTED: probable glutamate--tRNA ligase, mitochondrial [Nicrophorus vespilloides]